MKSLHRHTPPESKRSGEAHTMAEVIAVTDAHGQLELFWVSSSPRKGHKRLHAVRLSVSDTETVREALMSSGSSDDGPFGSELTDVEHFDDQGCIVHRGSPEADCDGCQFARRVVEALKRSV